MATPEDIRGHYVKVGGTRTFYDEIGEGQPIVCVHTAGASSLEYQYILPLFAKHGFHAFALDLPGHSRSYPEATPHGFAAKVFFRRPRGGLKDTSSAKRTERQ